MTFPIYVGFSKEILAGNPFYIDFFFWGGMLNSPFKSHKIIILTYDP